MEKTTETNWGIQILLQSKYRNWPKTTPTYDTGVVINFKGRDGKRGRGGEG